MDIEMLELLHTRLHLANKNPAFSGYRISFSHSGIGHAIKVNRRNGVVSIPRQRPLLRFQIVGITVGKPSYSPFWLLFFSPWVS